MPRKGKVSVRERESVRLSRENEPPSADLCTRCREQPADEVQEGRLHHAHFRVTLAAKSWMSCESWGLYSGGMKCFNRAVSRITDGNQE